jgi:biopolymer transport protein ExbD
MAKRRHAAKDEILLVPFLDILCSLIGVLILIIVVLCVSQTQQTEGRTEEEIRMAQEAKRLREQIVETKSHRLTSCRSRSRKSSNDSSNCASC